MRYTDHDISWRQKGDGWMMDRWMVDRFLVDFDGIAMNFQDLQELWIVDCAMNAQWS